MASLYSEKVLNINAGSLSPGTLVGYQRQKTKVPRLKTDTATTSGYTHLKYAKATSAQDVLQQAESLLSRGEFEQALLWFHRGRRMRPRAPEFTNGILKCEKAIEQKSGILGLAPVFNFTSLGTPTVTNSSPGFADSSRSSTRLSSQVSTSGSRTPHPPSSDRPQSRENHRGVAFIEKNLSTVGRRQIVSGDGGAGTKAELEEDMVKMEDSRTIFWKQPMPPHAVRALHQRHFGFPNNGVREELTLPRLSSRDAPRTTSSNISHYISREVHKIHQEFLDGRLEESVVRADRCLQTLHISAMTDLTRKYEMLSSVLNIKGNALLQQENYKEALKCFYKDFELAKEKDLFESKARALENLGRVYARISEFETAIKMWRDKLPYCKSEAERSWLYHELGYCYLSLKELTRAKQHGELAYAAADNAGDLTWQLNSSLLIAQAEVLMDDLHSALDTFKYASDLAKVLGDKSDQQHIHEAITGINNILLKPPQAPYKVEFRRPGVKTASNDNGEEDEEARELVQQRRAAGSASSAQRLPPHRPFLRAVTEVKKLRVQSISTGEDSQVTSGRSSVDPSARHAVTVKDLELDVPEELHGSGLVLRQRSFQVPPPGRLSKQLNYRNEEKQARAQFVERLLSERDQQHKTMVEIPTFAEPTKGILKNPTVRNLYSTIEEQYRLDPRRLFPAIAHSNLGNPQRQSDSVFEDTVDSSKKNSKSVRFQEEALMYHLPGLPPEDKPQELPRTPTGKVEIEGYFIGKYS